MISPYRRHRLACELREARMLYLEPYRSRYEIDDYLMVVFFSVVTVGILPFLCHLAAVIIAFHGPTARYQSNAENWDAFMQEVDSHHWVDMVRSEKSL